MIEGMNNEKRLEAIQNLLTRIEYTEGVIKPLTESSGQVHVDSMAIANMIVQLVLSQVTIMETLKEILLKDGETAVRMLEEPEQN